MEESKELEVLQPEAVEQKVPKFIPMELIESFKELGKSTLADAKLMPVNTQDDYDLAMVFRAQIKDHIERAKSVADPICEGLFRAHRNMCAIRNEMTADEQDADKILADRMATYVRTKRAEEERIRAEQLAEAKRLEQERQEALAKELEKAGEPKKAEEVRASPLLVDLPTPPKMTPPGTRKVWKVVEVDILKLAQYVVDNPTQAYFIEAVTSKITAYKRDNPKVEIPGVVFIHDDIIPVKRA